MWPSRESARTRPERGSQPTLAPRSRGRRSASFVRNGVDATKTVLRHAFHLAGSDLVPFPRLCAARWPMGRLRPLPQILPGISTNDFGNLRPHQVAHPSRPLPMLRALDAVAQGEVPGSIIEVGVWRGWHGGAHCGGRPNSRSRLPGLLMRYIQRRGQGGGQNTCATKAASTPHTSVHR